MPNNKTKIAICIWLFLAILMQRDLSTAIESPFDFMIGLIFGMFFSYYITTFLFGFDMINYGGSFLKKGENDIIRTIMFIVFSLFWLWSFISV